MVMLVSFRHGALCMYSIFCLVRSVKLWRWFVSWLGSAKRPSGLRTLPSEILEFDLQECQRLLGIEGPDSLSCSQSKARRIEV